MACVFAVISCPLPVYSLLWIPSAYTRRVAASQAYAKQPGKPSTSQLARDCESSMTAEVAAFHSHPVSALSGGTEGMYNHVNVCLMLH